MVKSIFAKVSLLLPGQSWRKHASLSNAGPVQLYPAQSLDRARCPSPQVWEHAAQLLHVPHLSEDKMKLKY